MSVSGLYYRHDDTHLENIPDTFTYSDKFSTVSIGLIGDIAIPCFWSSNNFAYGYTNQFDKLINTLKSRRG